VIEFKEGCHRLRGPVTLNSAAGLRQQGLEAFAREAGAGKAGAGETVLLDLSEVTEVDSSALSLVFEWRRELARKGRRLNIQAAPANLLSLATVYEVTDLLSGA